MWVEPWRALRRADSPTTPHALQVLDCAACPFFPAPAPIPITVGVVLIVGLVISYFFQFLSFFRFKSSKGVSSFSLGLALLSSMLTFTNFLILHWTTVICCACVDYSRCMTANLTPLQLFANVLSLLFVYSGFLWYYPLEPFSIYRQQRQREYLRARIILAVVLIVALIFSATSATLYYGLNLSQKTLATFGRAIGILSAIVVVVQWTPQIFVTFQLGSAGSLSIVMLLIQLPGCLLTVFFQAVIGGADITTWGPYLISGINTMILIIMCAVFWIRNRKGQQEDNFDILLSEDEHHVFEYDQDIGNIARKSYGSFAKVAPPSSKDSPSLVSSTPHSGKVAWSLSDRNGFKGNLSAATFITSGTSNRTRAHLSGKDLLGTSKPPNDLGLLEEDDMDGVFLKASYNDVHGTAQPPPRQHYRGSSSTASQRYLGSVSFASSNGIGDSSSTSASPSATPRKHPQDSSSSISSTPAATPSRFTTAAQKATTRPQTAASSFSNSLGVVESVGSFSIAPSSYGPPKPIAAFGTVDEVAESDVSDIEFTEDPLHHDKGSLDTPHGTMDHIKSISGTPSSPPRYLTLGSSEPSHTPTSTLLSDTPTSDPTGSSYTHLNRDLDKR